MKRPAERKEKKKPAPAPGEEALEEALESAEPEIIDEDEEPDPDAGEDEFALRPVEEESALAPPPSELLPSDPLHQYLAEISRHPLLTREEEVELSRRYREEEDLEAAYSMVVSNLRLVVKIAYEFRRNLTHLLDLIQEGNIGLMRAVEKFDPGRGVRLSSYAAWWIRAYMIRYILNNWSLVKIGTTQNQRRLFFNLKKEKEALEAQGFRPEPKLLASRLDVKESEIEEMEMRLAGPDYSLDVPVDESGETTRMEFLRDPRATAAGVLANAETGRLLHEKLMEFRETLNERDRVLFDERLVAEEPVTLREIGERFGVSRERVRQIEAEIKERLRLFLEGHREVLDVLE